MLNHLARLHTAGTIPKVEKQVALDKASLVYSVQAAGIAASVVVHIAGSTAARSSSASRSLQPPRRRSQRAKRLAAVITGRQLSKCLST